MPGSKYNDQMRANKRDEKHEYLSNHCGGILGGISNGEDIVARLSVKPTPPQIC